MKLSKFNKLLKKFSISEFNPYNACTDNSAYHVDTEKLRAILSSDTNFVKRYNANSNGVVLEFGPEELAHIEYWDFGYYRWDKLGYALNITTFGSTIFGKYFYIEAGNDISSMNRHANIFICKRFEELYNYCIPEEIIRDIQRLVNYDNE